MNQNAVIQGTDSQSADIQSTDIQSAAGEITGIQGSESVATPAAPPVAEGREQMDAVDAQIIELMLRRIEISRRIQAARLAEEIGRASCRERV